MVSVQRIRRSGVSFRVSVDTGGTFTDVVAIDDLAGRLFVTKMPSTPTDPSIALEAAIAEVAERSGRSPEDISTVIHGTTTATNAVVAHEFGGIGLIVTKGFRHILEIARQSVPDGYGNSFFWVKPPRLVPLHLTAEVEGRMDFRGIEIEPLDDESVLRAVDRLIACGVDRIGVCLLHAYANDSHEQRLGQLVAKHRPDLVISLSSVVLPEYREYERAMTTLLDVMVKPYCARYLRVAECRIKRDNEDCVFLIMQSNGGVTTAERAADKPVTMLLSGPAAGVLGAVHKAALSGFSDILTFDVGGTSTDVCVVRDGRPILTSDTIIEGYPVKVPMIDMATVGTGGGSVAWIDSHGFLKVGPASAGAVPGPISYGRGGQQPTVTDAALVLGRLPGALIGGELTLRADLARHAYEALGSCLGLSAEEAAAGVLEIAAANQVHGIRRVTVHKGIDPSTYCLVAFGGAAGCSQRTSRTSSARRQSSRRLIPATCQPSGCRCPTSGGTSSALSCASRPLQKPESPMKSLRPGRSSWLPGREELCAQGVPESATSILLGADLRYAGESYEVRVTFDIDGGVDEAAAEMWAEFHQAHNREFGYSYPGEQEVELVNLRVQAVGHIYRPTIDMRDVRPASRPAPDGDGGASRRAYWRGKGWVDCAIIDRATLAPGRQLAGPVIVQEYGSTVVVPEGWVAVCDDSYNMLLDRRPR